MNEYATLPVSADLSAVGDGGHEPGGLLAQGAPPEDEYPTALTGVPEYHTIRMENVEQQGDERDLAITGHPTVLLGKVKDEDEDEDDGVIFLPLPGQFADSPPPRAEHVQPQQVRAEHVQPESFRAQHQQPAQLRTFHIQPGGLVRKSRYGPGKAGLSMPNILIGAVTLVITSVIILLLIPGLHANGGTAPKLALVNAASAFPGGSVTLHGTNFTPGSAITFLADGVPLAPASEQAPSASALRVGMGVSASLDSALFTSQALRRAASATIVAHSDGAFDATITIPGDWQANTTHDIEASEQGSGQKALARVTIVDHVPSPVPATPQVNLHTTPTVQATATPDQNINPGPNPSVGVVPNVGGNVPTPTPQPAVQPTPTVALPTPTPPCLTVDNTTLSFSAPAGGGDPTEQSFTITNGNGCGAGTWSASADDSWLTLDRGGGTIGVNGTARVRVAISVANFKAGTYSSHIHLSPGSAVVTVTLTIQPATCITVSTDTLNFSGDIGSGGANPPAQAIAVTNCGSDGNVTATATTSDGANWLFVSGGGQVNAQGQTRISVRAACLNSDGRPQLSPGTYSGTVTVTIKANDGTKASKQVGVSFTVAQTRSTPTSNLS